MPRVTKSTKPSTRATKKPAAKKPAAKKTTARKPRARKSVELMFDPVKTKMGKSQIIQTLADNAEIDKKTAKNVLDVIGQMMMASICPKSVGHFALPGIIDIKTRHVPAKKVAAIKKGTEVRNPRTGEMTAHPGRAAYTKPATVKVKVRPLGLLKQVVA